MSSTCLLVTICHHVSLLAQQQQQPVMERTAASVPPWCMRTLFQSRASSLASSCTHPALAQILAPGKHAWQTTCAECHSNNIPRCWRRAFKYFVWLNSSVRGPFLPSYHPRDVHWTRAFVRKLAGDVKLVGATINCGGAYALSAQQPHVQSYAVAMDQVLSGCRFKFPCRFSRQRPFLHLQARVHLLCANRTFSYERS